MDEEIVRAAIGCAPVVEEEMPFVQTRKTLRKIILRDVTPALAEGIVLFSTVRFLDRQHDDNLGILYW